MYLWAQARYASDDQADFVVVDLDATLQKKNKALNSDSVPYVIPPPALLSYMRKVSS